MFDIRQTTSGPKSRVNKTSSTLKLVKLKLIIKTHNVSFHDGDLMNSNIMNKNNVLNKKMQETKTSSISTEDREGQKCSFDFYLSDCCLYRLLDINKDSLKRRI